MGILTEEMKRVVAQQQLCYAATVPPDGKPNLSPEGSSIVLSDDELEVFSPVYTLNPSSEAEVKRFLA
jgi:predicted pyridoxine 5'-phosphate oxidase superfamily flavin-nucleotide-binding protein